MKYVLSKLPLALIGCLAGGGAWWMVNRLKPGDEVQSVTVQPGQPFVLTYTQDGDQRYMVWMEVDCSYTNGYSLTGPILLSANNSPFGQWTLAEDGSGSPIQERNTAVRYGWTSTSLNGNGSADGTVQLFPIAAQADGATVTLSGTITAGPGVTVRSLRVFVAERD